LQEENENLLKNKCIGRITLCISNKCNLKCSYCYANGGNYNLPESLMTMNTASKFINFCTTNFDKINSIVFFGGEPLLNPKIIKFVCESFERLYKENKINYIPTWGLITNGTILNDEILNLIRKYIKIITVSIDGPSDLNDFNRKFLNGMGSYSKIAYFIKRIKNETDSLVKFEATYTSYHSQNNWSRADVKSFLKKEFNIHGTISDDINSQNDNNISIDNTETSFPEGFFGILRSMAYKKYKEMCLIGNNIIAVSADGDIYPCHMNIGKKHLSLGTINGNNFFNSREKYIYSFPYLNKIFKIEKPCINCWANPICGGCAMRWFYNWETNEYNSLPNNLLCETNKRYIEKILLLIVSLRKNKNKWAELLENLKNYDDYDYYR